MIWCIVGDFNVVRYLGERKGLSTHQHSSTKMQDLITLLIMLN